MMKRSALVLLLGLTACTPVVTHGPRVDPGVRFTGAFGLRSATCDSACGVATRESPILVMGLRVPFETADSSRPGVEASVELAGFDVGGDVYVQAPKRRAADYGAGLHASLTHVMPYVQYGRATSRYSRWYTTQGVVFGSRELRIDPNYFAATGGPDGVEPIYWAPSIAYQIGGASRSFSLFGSAGLGSYLRMRGETPEGRHGFRFLMIGLMAEVSASDLYDRSPRRPERCPLGVFCPPPRDP